MNIFNQFVKSLYSPKDIAMFRFQGIGKTIGYVFLLMFISTLITGISIGKDLLDWASFTNEKINEEVPPFTLTNGVLHSDLDTPLIKENDDFIFIFDTTNQLTATDISEYPNALALLKTEMVLVNMSEVQRLPYSSLGELSLTKEKVINFIDQLDTLILIILPLLFIFIYLFQTCLKFIGISFLGLLGLFLAKRINRKLNYSRLWILSAYAVTIPTLFFAITDALKITIPFPFFLYWATASIIIYLTLVEIPKSNQSIEDSKPSE